MSNRKYLLQDLFTYFALFVLSFQATTASALEFSLSSSATNDEGVLKSDQNKLGIFGLDSFDVLHPPVLPYNSLDAVAYRESLTAGWEEQHYPSMEYRIDTAALDESSSIYTIPILIRCDVEGSVTLSWSGEDDAALAFRFLTLQDSVADEIYDLRENSSLSFAGPVERILFLEMRPGRCPLPFVNNVNSSDGISEEHISVTWDRSPLTVSYEVWRSESSDFSEAYLVSSIPDPDVTSYQDANALQGTIYYYFLRGINDCGEGAPSTPDAGNLICEKPGQITGLNASKGEYEERIILHWNSMDKTDYYRVYRSTDPLIENAIEVSRIPQTSYTDDSVTSDTLYYYWVAGENICGKGEWSEPDHGYASCQIPTVVGGVEASDGTFLDSVYISWDENLFVEYYEVYRGIGTFEDSELIAVTESPEYTDTSRPSGEVFNYWVTGANSCGASEPGAGESGYADCRTPGVPENFTASDSEFGNQVLLVWDRAPDAMSYEVFRAEAGAEFETSAKIGETLEEQYPDMTALPGVSYQYYIRARNVCGISSGHISDEGSILCPDVNTPGEIVVSDGQAFVTIDWEPATDATGYRIYRSSVDEFELAQLLADIAGASFEDSTAILGQDYFYWVTSHNGCSESDPSVSYSGKAMAPNERELEDYLEGLCNLADDWALFPSDGFLCAQAEWNLQKVRTLIQYDQEVRHLVPDLDLMIERIEECDESLAEDFCTLKQRVDDFQSASFEIELSPPVRFLQENEETDFVLELKNTSSSHANYSLSVLSEGIDGLDASLSEDEVDLSPGESNEGAPVIITVEQSLESDRVISLPIEVRRNTEPSYSRMLYAQIVIRTAFADVTSVAASPSIVPTEGVTDLSAHIFNSGNADRSVLIRTEVLNEAGEVVETLGDLPHNISGSIDYEIVEIGQLSTVGLPVGIYTARVSLLKETGEALPGYSNSTDIVVGGHLGAKVYAEPVLLPPGNHLVQTNFELDREIIPSTIAEEKSVVLLNRDTFFSQCAAPPLALDFDTITTGSATDIRGVNLNCVTFSSEKNPLFVTSNNDIPVENGTSLLTSTTGDYFLSPGGSDLSAGSGTMTSEELSLQVHRSADAWYPFLPDSRSTNWGSGGERFDLTGYPWDTTTFIDQEDYTIVQVERSYTPSAPFVSTSSDRSYDYFRSWEELLETSRTNTMTYGYWMRSFGDGEWGMMVDSSIHVSNFRADDTAIAVRIGSQTQGSYHAYRRPGGGKPDYQIDGWSHIVVQCNEGDRPFIWVNGEEWVPDNPNQITSEFMQYSSKGWRVQQPYVSGLGGVDAEFMQYFITRSKLSDEERAAIVEAGPYLNPNDPVAQPELADPVSQQDTFEFSFDRPVSSFGFDLITPQVDGSPGVYAEIFDSSNRRIYDGFLPMESNGGHRFSGFKSEKEEIKKVVLNDVDEDGIDSHFAIDSLYCEIPNSYKADFVFIFDISGSMQDEIDAIKGGFTQFVEDLDERNINARFALVTMSFEHQLKQDFTSCPDEFYEVLDRVNDTGSGIEPTFEVIRKVLGASCTPLYVNPGDDWDPYLDFRPDARVNLIVVTDENSDLPLDECNRVAGQSGVSSSYPYEPNENFRNTGPWQTEIELTAEAIINKRAYINMIIGWDHPSYWQFGSPYFDVSDDDFLNFDPQETLAGLKRGGFEKTLQGLVLEAGLIGRTFFIQDMTANPENVEQFFQAKIEEILYQPVGIQTQITHNYDDQSYEIYADSIPDDATLSSESFEYSIATDLYGAQSRIFPISGSVENLLPGERREISHGTIIQNVIETSEELTTETLSIPALSVVGEHILEIQPSHKSVYAGESTSFEVSLYNPSNFSRQFNISVEGIEVLDYTIPSVLSLSSETTETVELIVNTDATTIDTTYPFLITIEGVDGVRDYAEGRIDVLPSESVPLDTQPEIFLEVEETGTEFTSTARREFSFRIANLGDTSTTVSLVGESTGYSVSLSESVIYLPSNSTEPIAGSIHLEPEEVIPVGVWALSLTAVSEEFSGVQKSENVEFEVIPQNVEIAFTKQLYSNEDTAEVLLRNTGDVDDTYMLRLSGEAASYSALDEQEITLSHGSEAVISIDIDHQQLLPERIYDLSVTAVSVADERASDVDQAQVEGKQPPAELALSLTPLHTTPTNATLLHYSGLASSANLAEAVLEYRSNRGSWVQHPFNPASGAFNLQVSDLDEGEVLVEARLTGENGEVTIERDLTEVDWTPPTLQIQSENTTWTKNDVTVFWTTTSNDVVTSHGVVEWTAPDTDLSTTRTLSFGETFTEEGEYIINTSATDQAGNIGKAIPVEFGIDRTHPLIITSAPQLTSEMSIPFQFELSDQNGSGIVQVLDHSLRPLLQFNPPVAGKDEEPGYRGISLPAEHGGSQEFAFFARDAAGNVSSADEVLVSIDRKSPEISIHSPQPMAIVDNEIQLEIELIDDFVGVDKSSAQYVLTEGDQYWKPLLFDSETSSTARIDISSLDDGPTTLTLKISDWLGNDGLTKPNPSNPLHFPFLVDNGYPPQAPTGLRAYFSDHSEITLTWDRYTESDFLHYQIYRRSSTESALAEEHLIAEDIVLSGSQSRGLYVDNVSSTIPGDWVYSIKAIDQARNESFFSDSYTVGVPDPPQELAAIGYDGYVDVFWEPVDDPAVSYYLVYRITQGEIYGERIAQVAANTHQYQDQNVVNGTSYRYYVFSVDHAHNMSTHSRLVPATPNTNPTYEEQMMVMFEDLTYQAVIDWDFNDVGVRMKSWKYFNDQGHVTKIVIYARGVFGNAGHSHDLKLRLKGFEGTAQYSVERWNASSSINDPADFVEGLYLYDPSDPAREDITLFLDSKNGSYGGLPQDSINNDLALITFIPSSPELNLLGDMDRAPFDIWMYNRNTGEQVFVYDPTTGDNIRDSNVVSSDHPELEGVYLNAGLIIPNIYWVIPQASSQIWDDYPDFIDYAKTYRTKDIKNPNWYRNHQP